MDIKIPHKLAKGDKSFLFLYKQIGIMSNNLHMTIEHKTCLGTQTKKNLLPGGQMRKDIMKKVMVRISGKGTR